MNIVKEHINFERGIDPKHAMGIGLIQQWIKWLNATENLSCYDIFFKDFISFYKEDEEHYITETVRIIVHTFIKIIHRKIPHQKAFEQSCKNELKSVDTELEKSKIKQKVAEILDKKFSMQINPK
jgi:hypothetical protein